MQFSNDILRQIVLTDNDIFSELKILLDYKDFEKQQVETRAETVEGRIDRYQTTITGLQQENEKLRKLRQRKILPAYDKQTIYLFGTYYLTICVNMVYIQTKKITKD
jgi:hypothetical protein